MSSLNVSTSQCGCACYIPTEPADSIIWQRIYCPTYDPKNQIPAVVQMLDMLHKFGSELA
jgi:hypothetical protein